MAAGAIGPTWDADSWDATAWDEDSWGDSPGYTPGPPVDQDDRRRRRIPRLRIRRG